MNHCHCGAEISEEEALFNGGECDQCAFSTDSGGKATDEKSALLAEYHAGMAQADQHWNEYLKTDSSKAFANYLAINRSLSVIYTKLVAYGMTLDEIKQQSDGGAFDANLA